MKKKKIVSERVYVYCEWYTDYWKEYFPQDFKYFLHIGRIENITLIHKDEHFLKHEAKAVSVKPVDLDLLHTKQIVDGAWDNIIQKRAIWDKAPIKQIRVISIIEPKYYKTLDANKPVYLDLEPRDIDSLKFLYMGVWRRNEYLTKLLIKELTHHIVSRSMLVCVIFIFFYVIFVIFF